MLEFFRNIILIFGFLGLGYLVWSYHDDKRDIITLFTRRIANFLAVASIAVLFIHSGSNSIPYWVIACCFTIFMITLLLILGTAWLRSGRSEEELSAKIVVVHIANVCFFAFLLSVSATEEGRELLGQWAPWSKENWTSGSTWSNWQSVIQLIIAIGATAGAFVGVRTRTLDQEEAVINKIHSTIKRIDENHSEDIRDRGDIDEEYEDLNKEFTSIVNSFRVYRSREVDIMLMYVIIAMICFSEFGALIYSSINPNDPITVGTSFIILMGGIPTIAILIGSMSAWMRRLGHLKEVRNLSFTLSDFERRLRQAH